MARGRSTRAHPTRSRESSLPENVEVDSLEGLINEDVDPLDADSDHEEHQGEGSRLRPAPSQFDQLAVLVTANAEQSRKQMEEMQKRMDLLSRVVEVFAEKVPAESIRDPAKGKGMAEDQGGKPPKPRLPASQRLTFGGNDARREEREAMPAPTARSGSRRRDEQPERTDELTPSEARKSAFARLSRPGVAGGARGHAASETRNGRKGRGSQSIFPQRANSVSHSAHVPPPNTQQPQGASASEGKLETLLTQLLQKLTGQEQQKSGVGGTSHAQAPTPAGTIEASGRYVLTKDAAAGPLTPEVMAVPYPPKFRAPAIPAYDGLTSPIAHTELFLNIMRSQPVPDEVLCQHFSTTLKDSAMDWYRQLKKNSISDFQSLGQALIDQFQGRHQQQMDSDHLLNLRQWDNESFTDFLARFRAETLKVNNLNLETAKSAFKAAVTDDYFAYKLNKGKYKTMGYQEILHHADQHSEALQAVATRDAPVSKTGARRSAQGERTEKKSYSPYVRQEKGEGSGFKKNQDSHVQSSDRRKEGATEAYTPRYGSARYTPLNRPVNEIVAILTGRGMLKDPTPLPPHHVKNRSKYCKFHHNYGHDTDECREAKDQLEELAQGGHLGEFVQRKKRSFDRRQRNQQKDEEEPHPAKEPRKLINTIFGGPAGGASNNKRKMSAREARHQVHSVRASPLSKLPTMFTETEASKIHQPHNDALVVALTIDNAKVRRMLVDTGSSTDLLSWAAYEELGWAKEQLKPTDVPLYGFSGERVMPLGVVGLPVIFGSGPTQISRVVDFVVTDAPSSYNGILGRPTLHALRAVASTYHQKLKFLTPRGIGEIRGEQQSSRECYAAAMKPPKCAPAVSVVRQDAPAVRVGVEQDDAGIETKAEAEVVEFQMKKKTEAEAEAEAQATAPSVEKLEKVQLSTDKDFHVNIGSELSQGRKDELAAFLQSNADVFASSPEDMPGIDPRIVVHRLSIDPSFKPVKQKKRTMDAERSSAASKEVTKLLSAGHIREVDYPRWLSNVVLVKKANGKWRMCVDFTSLNKACPKDSYPLPNIDQLVDATAGHELLSFMDAFAGYNQIRMNEADQEATSFITDRGTYCYKVMPFGLKNAGATYQRMVNRMFQHQIGRNMEVYVDDMLVKSKRAQDHLDDLAEAFDVLRHYRMKLNPDKCVFGVTSGKFLGFIVHYRGIEANPEKIKAVLELTAPASLKQLQSLNGKIASLNRFISRAADKCLPFFEILRKGIKFEWTPACEAALQELKAYLISAPVLAKPEKGEALFLYIAVSATAVSSVLVREDVGRQRPVYYVSKAMADAEKRYPELEKLALALIVAARRLRPYFQAHKIIVLTNYPLKQILHRAEVSGRLMKWTIELSEYEIEFKPRSAIKGQVLADFVADLTAPEETSDLVPATSWTLHVDGASNDKGSGAGILLVSPEGHRHEYAVRFKFAASNNEAEYEALLAGLRLAKAVGVDQLEVRSDSLLVVNQVLTEYEAKDDRMAKYLAAAQRLIAGFGQLSIKQVPRSQNSNADALARLAASHPTDLPRTVLVEVLQEASIEGQEVQSVDSEVEVTWMTPIYRYLGEGHLPEDRAEARRLIRRSALYVIWQERLYKRGFSLPMLRCLGPTEADFVMKEIHEGLCGNHSGPRSLAHKIVRQGYFWPTMRADAKKFAQSCDRCQRFASVPHQPAEALASMSSPWPFAQWGIDIIGPFPVTPGAQYKFAVVAVDYFTKWAEAEPLRTITAEKIANFVWRNIICRFGIPNVIVSDNGKQFECQRFAKLCSELGISHRRSSPAHPQANGQVEAVNKTIKTLLKAKLTAKCSAWATELPGVLWAYRTTQKNATGETPFTLAFGTEAVVPVEMGMTTFRLEAYDPATNDNDLRAELDFVEELRDEAHLRVMEQKKRIERYYNARVRPRMFKVGDLVLRKVMQNKRTPNASALQPTWEGPYQVREVARPGTYYLDERDGTPVPRPWNVEHLRAYHT